MDLELKEKIDRIHSLNIGQEQKMALFGKLMETKFGPLPDKTQQPGLMNGFAMEGINDPDPIPTRPQPTQGPTVDRGPLAGPENNILRDNPLMEALGFRKPDQPMPNTYFGQPVERSETPFVPLAKRWETAAKMANPIDPRTAGGSMNLVNPLPPEQNRAAIRAALPGAQGLVATGGFPPKGMGMQSGRGPGQIPTMPDTGIMSGTHSGLGTPGNEYRDPATFL
jgi:hypothetical protein